MFLKRSHRDLSIAIKKFKSSKYFSKNDIKIFGNFQKIFKIHQKISKKNQKLTKTFKNSKISKIGKNFGKISKIGKKNQKLTKNF